jgi:hypothetical protein
MDVSFEDISSKSRYSEPSPFTILSINQVANGFSCDSVSRGNWQKETQRYYGIKWSQTQLSSSSNNEHELAWTDIPSCLPSGFFIISLDLLSMVIK